MRLFHAGLGLLLLASTLPLAACSTLTLEPQVNNSALVAVPRVENSAQSPCWQQRQIAAQNSWLDNATKKANAAVYKGPCDLHPAPAPASPKQGPAVS